MLADDDREQRALDQEDARYRLDRLVAAIQYTATLEDDVKRLTQELARAKRRLREAKDKERNLTWLEKRRRGKAL